MEAVQVLRNTKAINDIDYDQAETDYKTTKAGVTGGEAAVEQAKIVLTRAETNLDFTTIISPVKGVIIDRRVNVGQNVAPGGPSLFLIATDLGKLQVWPAVNEADIARIKNGMDVRFTVDAFPRETFKGKVAQIRLNAAMTQNVVTYTVVVACENPGRKLMPYMTANLEFIFETRPNVLRVPNAALRWKPSRPELAVLGTPEAAKDAKDRLILGRLWVKEPDGQHVRPIEVQVGMTDGTRTEVSGPDVNEGTEVVVGEAAAGQPSGETDNPFAPKPFKAKNAPPAAGPANVHSPDPGKPAEPAAGLQNDAEPTKQSRER